MSLLVILISILVSCTPIEAPKPTATQTAMVTSTLTPTVTPIPVTPTFTPTATPIIEKIGGLRPIVAFEVHGDNRDGDCEQVDGVVKCKDYIYVGDPATNHPYFDAHEDTTCRSKKPQRPEGDWRRLEVIRETRNEQPIKWLPDGSGFIYVRETTNKSATLSFYDWDMDKSRDIKTGIPSYGVEFLTISPDSRWVAYATDGAARRLYVISLETDQFIQIATNISKAAWANEPDTLLYLLNTSAVGYSVRIGQPSQTVPMMASSKIAKLVKDMEQLQFGYGYRYNASLMGTFIDVRYEEYDSEKVRPERGWFLDKDQETLIPLVHGNIPSGNVTEEFVFSPDRTKLLINIYWRDFSGEKPQEFPFSYSTNYGEMLELPKNPNHLIGLAWTPDSKYFAAYFSDRWQDEKQRIEACKEKSHPYRIVVVNAENNSIVAEYPLLPQFISAGYNYNHILRGIDVVWKP